MRGSIRSQRRCRPWVLAALCAVVAGARAHAQATIGAAQLTDEHVKLAIQAIVDKLHRQKDPKRFWDPAPYPDDAHRDSKGGWTPLTVLALIEAQQNGATLGRLPADRELATAVWAIYFHAKLADHYLKAIKPKLVARMDGVW